MIYFFRNFEVKKYIFKYLDEEDLQLKFQTNFIIYQIIEFDLQTLSSGQGTGCSTVGTAPRTGRPSSGRTVLMQRVEQMKQKDSQFLKSNSNKEKGQNINNQDHIKIDQKVGPDIHLMPNSAKSTKSLKDMFKGGTSKFMTMKQADIQLVELLEKIRKKTKTEEKKEQNQNLIVPGMKKGFNAFDINNVVDTALERAQRSRNSITMQTFTAIDQNSLKTPQVSRIQRSTETIHRQNTKTSKKTLSELIGSNHFETESNELIRRDSNPNIKQFKISQTIKQSSLLKLTEATKNQNSLFTINQNDDENINDENKNTQNNLNEIKPNTDDKNNQEQNVGSQHQLQIQADDKNGGSSIRRRSLIIASGLLCKEAPLLLLSASQKDLNSVPINRNQPKENKNVKISFQIKVTKEEQEEEDKENEKQNIKDSELLDFNDNQNNDKFTQSQQIDPNLKKNLLDISNIKKSQSQHAEFQDESINIKDLQFDFNKKKPTHNNQNLRESRKNQILQLSQSDPKQVQRQFGQRSSLELFENMYANSSHNLDASKATQSLDRNKQQNSLPLFNDRNLSPTKTLTHFSGRYQHSQSSQLNLQSQSPTIKSQSFKDLSSTFTKKEINKFDIEKRILQNLEKIGKQLRVQKKVNLPEKLQSRSRIRPLTAKAQQEKYPFKFSPSFVSNWVDLRSKIEIKYEIPQKFHTHKVLNKKIREVKNQKICLSNDNSFYVYEPEYTTYYL